MPPLHPKDRGRGQQREGQGSEKPSNANNANANRPPGDAASQNRCVEWKTCKVPELPRDKKARQVADPVRQEPEGENNPHRAASKVSSGPYNGGCMRSGSTFHTTSFQNGRYRGRGRSAEQNSASARGGSRAGPPGPLGAPGGGGGSRPAGNLHPPSPGGRRSRS